MLVSILFSFLLSILLVLLSVLVILRISLSEASLQKLAADKTYHGIILGDIQNNAHDYTLPTGIDPSILEGVFEASEVSRDVKIAISNAFAGIKDSEPDTSELKNRIITRATAFYAQSDEQLAEVDMEAVVKAYANDISEIYTNGLKIIGIEYRENAQCAFRTDSAYAEQHPEEGQFIFCQKSVQLQCVVPHGKVCMDSFFVSDAKFLKGTARHEYSVSDSVVVDHGGFFRECCHGSLYVCVHGLLVSPIAVVLRLVCLFSIVQKLSQCKYIRSSSCLSFRNKSISQFAVLTKLTRLCPY